MKTIKDLEEMKNKANRPFGTVYNFFILDLANDLISKVDGKERVEFKLREWDEEAKLFIMKEVSRKMKAFL